MCLIAMAYRVHPRWPLVLVGNRDEAHARPAAPAGPDPAHPGVVGGRDLRQGGSWLQAGRHGRVAAVTNVRHGLTEAPAPRSRGALVTRFAASSATAADAARALASEAGDYGRFNLVLFDGADAWYAGNHPHWRAHGIAPGLHVLSNGAFDAAWPKSRRAGAALDRWLATGSAGVDALLLAMADERPVPDAELPDTGVPQAIERALAPPFIRGRDYGTRATTILLAAPDAVWLHELRYGPEGMRGGASTLSLTFAPS